MAGLVAVQVPKSPIFSSPRIPSIFIKPCPSPTILGSQSPTSLSLQPSLSAPSGSPRSPLVIRVNETGLEANSAAVLKRKRPGRIVIPVVAGILGFGLETPRREEERMEVMEAEGDGYSVYCKRGRRGLMEDRFSASIDVNADYKRVPFLKITFWLCFVWFP